VTRTADDPTQAGTHIPVKDLGQAGANRADGSATDVTRGAQDGDEDGTGRGWAGTGTGKGMGFGDIDWGGGGNRIVLNKVKPQFPPGTLDTKVQLRFRVRPDGTVSIVTPMRKGGNPAADQAAIKAMYQWRFNPLSTDKDMEGTITFVFKSS
jgi:TonB family protein